MHYIIRYRNYERYLISGTAAARYWWNHHEPDEHKTNKYVELTFWLETAGQMVKRFTSWLSAFRDLCHGKDMAEGKVYRNEEEAILKSAW